MIAVKENSIPVTLETLKGLGFVSSVKESTS